MLLIEQTQWTPGPDIRFHCPACKQQDVIGSAYEQEITDWYLGVIPLLNLRVTRVFCLRCGIMLNANAKLADLLDKTPQDLSSLLYVSTSFIQKSLAIIALIMALLPMVGCVMSLIAIIANWRT